MFFNINILFLPFSLPSPSSSVLLSSSNSATMVTWRHTSLLYWKWTQWIIQNTKRILSRRKKTLGRFMSPHLRKSGLRNPRNFCLWNPESRKFLFVESGILNTAQGIRNPLMIAIAGIHSTTSTDTESGILYLESGIHGVESRIPDCLRFHYYLGQFMNDIL